MPHHVRGDGRVGRRAVRFMRALNWPYAIHRALLGAAVALLFDILLALAGYPLRSPAWVYALAAIGGGALGAPLAACLHWWSTQKRRGR